MAHRNLLFTVAYEMLGSAADAEDVLQEVWLRWSGVELDEVRDPRAYLVRITTRLALNQLRTSTRRREEYVGPWLPEPLLTTPDVAEDVELAEGTNTIVYAWGSAADDNLDLKVQTITGLHSSPSGVPSGSGGQSATSGWNQLGVAGGAAFLVGAAAFAATRRRQDVRA